MAGLIAKTDEYTLGSGDLYILEYAGTTPTVDNVISTGDRLGEIKGGATIEYSAESKEESSDLGRTKIVAITKEDVTLKSGVMTWNGDTLAKLCQTARVTTSGSGASSKRITKIGGLANASNKSYALAFEYKGDGKTGLKALIVGKNNSGFTISFDPDNPTVIDATFVAQSMDDDGTLVEITEDDPDTSGS